MDKYLLSLILTVIIGPLVGYYIHKMRTRVDLDAQKEKAPFEVLQAAITSREREISVSREQMALFIKDHMKEDREERALDRQERDQLIEVLTQSVEAMRAVKDELGAHRQEEAVRTAAIHARLDDIKSDVNFIKGGIGRG